jgi:hypothetical protein
MGIRHHPPPLESGVDECADTRFEILTTSRVANVWFCRHVVL